MKKPKATHKIQTGGGVYVYYNSETSQMWGDEWGPTDVSKNTNGYFEDIQNNDTGIDGCLFHESELMPIKK